MITMVSDTAELWRIYSSQKGYIDDCEEWQYEQHKLSFIFLGHEGRKRSVKKTIVSTTLCLKTATCLSASTVADLVSDRRGCKQQVGWASSVVWAEAHTDACHGRRKLATSASGSKATKQPDTPRTEKVRTNAGGRCTSGSA